MFFLELGLLWKQRYFQVFVVKRVQNVTIKIHRNYYACGYKNRRVRLILNTPTIDFCRILESGEMSLLGKQMSEGPSPTHIPFDTLETFILTPGQSKAKKKYNAN